MMVIEPKHVAAIQLWKNVAWILFSYAFTH